MRRNFYSNQYWSTNTHTVRAIIEDDHTAILWVRSQLTVYNNWSTRSSGDGGGGGGGGGAEHGWGEGGGAVSHRGNCYSEGSKYEYKSSNIWSHIYNILCVILLQETYIMFTLTKWYGEDWSKVWLDHHL